MPPPNSKIFNRALNKTILFLTSWNEEFVKKKRFPWKKHFLLPGISNKWKKRFFTSQKNGFYKEPWRFSVKIGFCIISIMLTTSKKNTIILKNNISPWQKSILQLCFCWWKLLLKLGRIQFFKNNLFPASGN